MGRYCNHKQDLANRRTKENGNPPKISIKILYKLSDRLVKCFNILLGKSDLNLLRFVKLYWQFTTP